MSQSRTFHSPSESATANLAAALAVISQRGDIFALFGTLGMGKSVFARSFIQSFLGNVEVPSPTFTLLQTYEATDFDIYHFDLYRLKNPDEIFEIGLEDALYSGVSLIEWPEMMGVYLPKDIFRIEITPEGQGRKITITAGSEEKAKRLESIGYE